MAVVRTWLTDTRTSYDTVAVSYADRLRDSIARSPSLRMTLGLFASLVRETGPVADVGCGTGHVTAHLNGLGLDAFGLDLSPGMIEVARRDHPGSRFAVGSMTALPLPDASVAGLLSWWSLIHVPDDEAPAALAQFHRVLRPGAPVAIGFHVGDVARVKTRGYGGHPNAGARPSPASRAGVGVVARGRVQRRGGVGGTAGQRGAASGCLRSPSGLSSSAEAQLRQVSR
ncbi:Malonyl-[acyl-carrier protein] O-methyltransferase [Amycolatopsis sp. M39]|nr:Malonyl-[acyl-carrier protein] O-methyltransferase [Amycolatopsis sp. M39]